MSNYQRKIAPGLELLITAIGRVNESNSDLAHEWVDDLSAAQDALENPFQTVPPQRYIHITTSFCDKDGSSYRSDDDDIDVNREISAAMLYSLLNAHIKAYDPSYRIQVNIPDLEDWLNTQYALLRTVNRFDYDYPTIEDKGLTVANIKTDYGSIDFFIEFGIIYGDHE